MANKKQRWLAEAGGGLQTAEILLLSIGHSDGLSW
jgi:hypothetical protein